MTAFTFDTSGAVDLGACERCQGNGEIVTDWGRYLSPQDGDAGDEATADCPDCGGRGELGKVTFPDLSPFMQGYVRAAFESLPFFHMECPSCEWDCVIGPPKVGDLGICCPLCAADNGRDVRLRTEARVSRDWTGTVEGSDDRKKGFSDLAPATLAAMMADCERFLQLYAGGFRPEWEADPSAGRALWEGRQAGRGDYARDGFPPVILTIHDDGLVYQEART